MTDWVIWYDDSSSFSSDDGEPWDAPRERVVCIAMAHPDVGRFLISGDFYCWHFGEQEFAPHDVDGMHSYLRKPGGRKVVLFGYMLGRDRWLDVMNKAVREDDRLPPRTAEGSRGIPDAMKYNR